VEVHIDPQSSGGVWQMSPHNYLRKLDQYWRAGTRQKVLAALPVVLIGLAIPLFTETFLTDVFTSMLILIISALGFNFAFGFADVEICVALTDPAAL